MASLLLLSLALGCELKGTEIPETCEREGQRCRIDDNVLGVCAVDLTASCQEGPCFRCMDQH